VDLRTSLDRCGKSRPTGFRTPDRPARRHSLYRLRYPAHMKRCLTHLSPHIYMSLEYLSERELRCQATGRFVYAFSFTSTNYVTVGTTNKYHELNWKLKFQKTRSGFVTLCIVMDRKRAESFVQCDNESVYSQQNGQCQSTLWLINNRTVQTSPHTPT